MSAGTRGDNSANRDLREKNEANHASKANTLVLAALWIALVVVCGGGGILASWVLLPDPQPSAPNRGTQADARQSQADPDAALRPASLTTAQAITAARRSLFVDGNADSALVLYRQALAGMTKPPPLIQLETATCLELIGRHDEAAEWHHRVANSTQRPHVVLMAELGEARCWLAAKEFELAATRFYELCMDPRVGRCIAEGGASAAAAKTAAAEAAYGLTDALTRPMLDAPRDLWLDDYVTAPPLFSMTSQRLLRPLQSLAALMGETLEDNPLAPNLDEASEQAAPNGETAGRRQSAATVVSLTDSTDETGHATHARPGVSLIYQVSGNVDEVQFSVGVNASPVLPLIDQLLDLAGQQAVWSDSVRTTLLGRTTTVDEPNLSLGMLLDSLLTPFGVVWSQDKQGGAIHFVLAATLTQEDQLEKLHNSALRAARRAVRAYPDHPSLPSAILAIGNLMFAERQLDSATAQYEMLLRRHGQTDSAPRAWFNLGKIHLQRRVDEAALAAFYRVVDGARGGELRHYAALYAGRLHLEHEQLLQANRILRRARTRSKSTSVQAAAAVLQATVLLREGNPHAANTVLMDSRPALAIHRRDMAALLGAMARFQTATADTNRLVQGRALVATLAHASPNEFFGKYGAVILGEAYAELGLYDEMAGAYQVALEDGITGAPAERMRLALARVRREQGEYEDASMLYQQLTANASKEEVRRPTIILAMIEQAELEFQLRRDQRCLQLCQQLIDEATNDANKTRVLQLMGRTYSRMGDHARAALCFAGLRPEDAPPQSTTESKQ